jgi:hypothetical protein
MLRHQDFASNSQLAKWLVTFYKKNVKENISPTTGHRPDIQPLYVSTRLWFPSLVALVGAQKRVAVRNFSGGLIAD